MIMEFSALMAQQIDRDRRRGFSVDFEDDTTREQQITHDLVGLVGEIGEFSNILKKVTLARTIPRYRGQTLAQATPELREELADAAIYIFRLAKLLNTDLEADILKKISYNDQRYGHLEQ
jgi:NTP pyrophosphatase (non-canonical NTP hydrolase)